MSIDRHQVGQSTATGLIIINDALFARIAQDSEVKSLIMYYLRRNPNKSSLTLHKTKSTAFLQPIWISGLHRIK